MADDEDDGEGQSPHDTLFHLAFSDPKVARAELEAMLPADVCAALDLARMRPVPVRTVSGRLRSLFSDVVYEIPLASGEAVFAWFHLEHQSQAERLMAFRVLRYHVHRWSTYLRSPAGRARGRLPLVLSVVVLHDRDGRQAPARLSALYDAPEALVARLRPLLPEYTLLVDDLMARSEEDLGQRAASALYTLTLWLLKVRGEVAPEGLGACEALFRRLAVEEGAEVARAVLHYVLRTSREADPVALQAARAVDAQLTEDVMGIWQQRIEEGVARGREVGREAGREVGREEGRSSVLLALLSARFGTLPPETEGRVRDADAVTVARWALRVLSAQSLAEVFEDG